MKPLTHPGERLQPRIKPVAVTSKTVVRQLSQGKPLTEQLTDIVAEHGATSGAAELYSGSCDPVSYVIPTAGDSRKAVGFSETRVTPVASYIYGAATIGHRFGEPFVHSHSMWANAAGETLGGHLWPDTIVGAEGVHAVVHIFDGVDLISADDPETDMPVFTPHASERRVFDVAVETQLRNTVVARVLPGEDITEAIIKTSKASGFDSVSVRAGIGSLVGGEFVNRATRETFRVDGPGTEVIALIGHVSDLSAADPEVRLSCTMVDRHGVVHAGELIAGANPVAVTFELVLQEMNQESK